MKNSFPASRLDIDQDILGSMNIETITDLLLGEILADLEELILAHRSAAVFVHVLEHLDNYDKYDKYDNYVPIPSLSIFRHHHKLVFFLIFKLISHGFPNKNKDVEPV